MNEKLIEKMLGQTLRQYGRHVEIDPITPHEKQLLKQALTEKRLKEPAEDLHAHIEDVIYDYVTNQGLFS
ncbi:YqzH family protein [Bacillus changyiensis]|uniref:YqzH family protein n=1 Tax=Bacillus changyiensis TaxID=3004103 RepID=UPI0022E1BB5B|nr:YqzH family protein [Bacillus changyiensis]MDA1474961.1 YqzH family protein [Bacillus changyiensis]